MSFIHISPGFSPLFHIMKALNGGTPKGWLILKLFHVHPSVLRVAIPTVSDCVRTGVQRRTDQTHVKSWAEPSFLHPSAARENRTPDSSLARTHYTT